MKIIIEVDGDCCKEHIIPYMKALNIDGELIRSIKFEDE